MTDLSVEQIKTRLIAACVAKNCSCNWDSTSETILYFLNCDVAPTFEKKHISIGTAHNSSYCDIEYDGKYYYINVKDFILLTDEQNIGCNYNYKQNRFVIWFTEKVVINVVISEEFSVEISEKLKSVSDKIRQVASKALKSFIARKAREDAIDRSEEAIKSLVSYLIDNKATDLSDEELKQVILLSLDKKKVYAMKIVDKWIRTHSRLCKALNESVAEKVKDNINIYDILT